MTKIILQLVKLGWIETYRGKGGGFCLSKTALTLTVGQIVRELETSVKPIDCFAPLCPLQGKCGLERVLWQAQSAYLQVLDKVTLVELMK